MMGLAKRVLQTYETLVRRPGLPKALRYAWFMESHWIVTVCNCDKEIGILLFCWILCMTALQFVHLKHLAVDWEFIHVNMHTVFHYVPR